MSLIEKYLGEAKKVKVNKGPKWEYYDARGVKHKGTMKDFSDKGGTDITYFFNDEKTGELSVVSGSLIKKMKRIFK